MLFMSTMYYAWLAYQLAKKTGRNDVTALPSGTSVILLYIGMLIGSQAFQEMARWARPVPMPLPSDSINSARSASSTTDCR